MAGVLETVFSWVDLMDKEEKIKLADRVLTDLGDDYLVVERKSPRFAASKKPSRFRSPVWLKRVDSLDAEKNGAFAIEGEWANADRATKGAGVYVAGVTGGGDKKWFVLQWEAGQLALLHLPGDSEWEVSDARLLMQSEDWEEIRDCLVKMGVRGT